MKKENYDDEVRRLSNEIMDREKRLDEIREEKEAERQKKIQVGMYFRTSDGISYSAYHKILKLKPVIIAYTILDGEVDNYTIDSQDIVNEHTLLSGSVISETEFIQSFEKVKGYINKVTFGDTSLIEKRNISSATLKLASTVFAFDSSNYDSLNEILDLIKKQTPKYISDIQEDLNDMDIFISDGSDDLSIARLFDYIEFNIDDL